MWWNAENYQKIFLLLIEINISFRLFRNTWRKFEYENLMQMLIVDSERDVLKYVRVEILEIWG